MQLDIVLILRVVQELFAIIVLGLTGHVTSVLDDLLISVYTPAELRFLLFVSVWSFFIVVPYLVIVPIWFPRFAHVYGLLALEGVVTIFWFAGFIALAANLPPDRACRYAPDGMCQELQAATAFGALSFAAFAASIVFVVLRFRGTKSSPSGPEPAPA